MIIKQEMFIQYLAIFDHIIITDNLQLQMHNQVSYLNQTLSKLTNPQV